jgi:hypothetical protein
MAIDEPSFFYNLHCWEPCILPGKAPPPNPVIESYADQPTAIQNLRTKNAIKDEYEDYYISTPTGKFLWINKEGSLIESEKPFAKPA